MKEVKKEQGKSQREFAKVDADIREKENAIQKKRPAFIKAKEKATHLNVSKPYSGHFSPGGQGRQLPSHF